MKSLALTGLGLAVGAVLGWAAVSVLRLPDLMDLLDDDSHCC